MLKIEAEREVDGRWIAEVLALPGALACGATEIKAQWRQLLWRAGWWPR